MKTISRPILQEKLAFEGITLIDVLDHQAFRAFHIPGAINVPFRNGFDAAIQRAIPNKASEVVVYGSGASARVSATASRRMARLGYQNVAYYAGGKEDWRAAGLATWLGR